MAEEELDSAFTALLKADKKLKAWILELQQDPASVKLAELAGRVADYLDVWCDYQSAETAILQERLERLERAAGFLVEPSVREKTAQRMRVLKGGKQGRKES